MPETRKDNLLIVDQVPPVFMAEQSWLGYQAIVGDGESNPE